MNRNQRLVLVISILASFVTFLDGSIVNIALPAIVRDLGGGFAVQQWVVNAYLITLGSLMLIAGSVSDIFGRRRVLIGGLIGFGAASLLCALAPTAIVLIIARGLQGVAGAFLVPSSLALIIANFSGSAQSKAIGSWTAWTGIAFLVGPLLGGFIIDIASWRLIFAINVLPIAITLGLITKLVLVEKPIRAPIDILGAVLAAFGIGLPVYALIEQSHYGFHSPAIYLPLLVGLALFICFIWHERRAAQPMVPLTLFTVRNFAIGNAATLLLYGALSVGPLLVTLFLQQVSGYKATQAGLALLPIR